MIEVIYEDKDTVAVNKPPGLVVFHEVHLKEAFKKEETLSSLLIKQVPKIENIGNERNGAVHRLDKDTSGIILFAKNEKALSFLQEQLLEKKAKKSYIALVFKSVKQDKGEINTFIERSPKDRRKQKAFKAETGKRQAVTFFKTVEKFDEYSLLEVYPQTGRKHQIRCHLAHIGHPIAGDKLYKFKDQKNPVGLKRQFLHAKSIKIKLPNKEVKTFEAPLFEDLKEILKNLS